MRADLLHYELPQSAIASRPLDDRERARLLVLDDSIEHRHVCDWPDLLETGSLVVLNNTRVFKARLFGVRRRTGGRVELLLLRYLSQAADGRQRWRAVGRSSKPLKAGDGIDVGPLRIEVAERAAEGMLVLDVQALQGTVEQQLEQQGHVPIPPYMRRMDDAGDERRYQTVFAKYSGSVAAPTAGLHLSEALLDQMRERGIELGELTLHVGHGTFRPVLVDDLTQHSMHAEWYEISSHLARQIATARRRSAPVVAVGTTVVRALESAADPRHAGRVVPGAAETRLLIQPGYPFRVTDALLTNFHMPRSTLLALVAAFSGRDRVIEAYAEALARGYRFLSYGDAMWIPRRSRGTDEAGTPG